jgi:predicted phage tail protein
METASPAVLVATGGFFVLLGMVPVVANRQMGDLMRAAFGERLMAASGFKARASGRYPALTATGVVMIVGGVVALLAAVLG